MPESPPVIRAALPCSLPEPLYRGAWYCGRGIISESRPGLSCFCGGKGGLGWVCVAIGSCSWGRGSFLGGRAAVHAEQPALGDVVAAHGLDDLVAGGPGGHAEHGVQG